MCIEVILCNVSVVFLRHSVYVQCYGEFFVCYRQISSLPTSSSAVSCKRAQLTAACDPMSLLLAKSIQLTDRLACVMYLYVYLQWTGTVNVKVESTR